MINVSVTSEIFGSVQPQDKIPSVILKLASEQITLKEIIERSVQEQIDCMKRKEKSMAQIEKDLRNQYLSQEDIDELASEGKVAYVSASEDKAKFEALRALNAFRRKRFKVFIDGEEVQDLAEKRAIYEGCTINFVRLIPLAGG